MRKLIREPALGLTLLLLVLLMAAFIIYPQVQVVITPGLAGYVYFFREGMWQRPLMNSVVSTLLATTTAVLFGLIYAYAMVSSDMRWKPFFRLVGMLPLLSPPFVVAASYILLFGPRGVISWHIFGQSLECAGDVGAMGRADDCLLPLCLPVDRRCAVAGRSAPGAGRAQPGRRAVAGLQERHPADGAVRD